MNRFRNAVIGFLFCTTLLCGCNLKQSEPETTAQTETTIAETTDERLGITQLQVQTTADEIFRIPQDYPNLEKLDLSGSTCYSEIYAFCLRYPQIDVTYTVSLGNVEVNARVSEVHLNDGEADFRTMRTNLLHLPEVTSITMPVSSLTQEEVDELASVYPNVSFAFTVHMLGTEYPADTEQLDLSGISPEDIPQITEALPQFSCLSYVELMKDGSCSLSRADVKQMIDAAPNTIFHYEFVLFGRTVSSTDETISFKNLNLTNEAESEIRSALDVLCGCSTLILEDCGLDNEVLASIRADYPRTQLAWRVRFGKYSAMTNQETIRAVYNVFDDTCFNLRYCISCKYMDIGHNETLTDLSFVGYMPNLEILIASGCAVSDLSGFENCKKLEFLELAFCGKLKDITPLSGCEGLKNLNISYTKVTDLQPLDGVPLERFICKQTPVSVKEQNQFNQIHEGCVIRFTGKEAYAGSGWRYVDNGITYTEIYKKVREVFGYDDMVVETIPKD